MAGCALLRVNFSSGTPVSQLIGWPKSTSKSTNTVFEFVFGWLTSLGRFPNSERKWLSSAWSAADRWRSWTLRMLAAPDSFHSLVLVDEVVCKGGGVLVFCSSKDKCAKAARFISDRFKQMRINSGGPQYCERLKSNHKYFGSKKPGKILIVFENI